MLLSCLIPIVATAQVNSGTYGSAYRYNQGYPTKYIKADTPSPTIADNGTLYMMLDDTPAGFQGTVSGGRNIYFASCDGYTSSMTCSQVNAMDAWGNFNTSGSDGLTFKSSGCISVGGVIYCSVDRQSKTLPGGTGTCPSGVGFTKQNAQIIKSSDHGTTWTPAPPSTDEPYASPMFSGTTFASLWPIQYGQDYSCDGRDNCKSYVYWLSPGEGYQSEANTMYLARVSIANLPNLNGANYTYYQGGDGMSDSAWGARNTAQAVISWNCHVGEAGAVWVPAVKRYVMLQFWYPAPATTSDTFWAIMQAPHPWGPWTQAGSSAEWNPQAYYMNAIVPSSVGDSALTVFTAGDYGTAGSSDSTTLYTPTIVQLTLQNAMDAIQGVTLQGVTKN